MESTSTRSRDWEVTPHYSTKKYPHNKFKPPNINTSQPSPHTQTPTTTQQSPSGLSYISSPTPTQNLSKKRQCEDHNDGVRASPKNPKTPAKKDKIPPYPTSPCQIEPIQFGVATAYGPDQEMEEETDWTKEDRHFNWLYRV